MIIDYNNIFEKEIHEKICSIFCQEGDKLDILFSSALAQKFSAGELKRSTVKRYIAEYKRLLSFELRYMYYVFYKCDDNDDGIVKLDLSYWKKYTDFLFDKIGMCSRAFSSYKTILNIIYKHVEYSDSSILNIMDKFPSYDFFQDRKRLKEGHDMVLAKIKRNRLTELNLIDSCYYMRMSLKPFMSLTNQYGIELLDINNGKGYRISDLDKLKMLVED